MKKRGLLTLMAALCVTASMGTSAVAFASTSTTAMQTDTEDVSETDNVTLGADEATWSPFSDDSDSDVVSDENDSDVVILGADEATWSPFSDDTVSDEDVSAEDDSDVTILGADEATWSPYMD